MANGDDPIDLVARAGAEQRSREAAEDAREAAAAAEEERRRQAEAPDAVVIEDEGRMITVRHTAGRLLQRSPRGVVLMVLGCACLLGALVLLFNAMTTSTSPPSPGSAPGSSAEVDTLVRGVLGFSAAFAGLLAAGFLYVWWRAGNYPALVVRVTAEGNVGLLDGDTVISVGQPRNFFFSVVQKAQVWGTVRWVGKCDVSAFGSEIQGRQVYGRRVFGLTQADVGRVTAFAERHGIIYGVSEFSSRGGAQGTTYEDRGLWT